MHVHVQVCTMVLHVIHPYVPIKTKFLYFSFLLSGEKCSDIAHVVCMLYFIFVFMRISVDHMAYESYLIYTF